MITYLAETLEYLLEFKGLYFENSEFTEIDSTEYFDMLVFSTLIISS